MITDKGKSLVGKFLLEQIPAYASYIAIGSGADPASAGTTTGIASKRSLEFEVARIPITSRGLVNDAGTEVLVFGGDAPSQDRVGITEIAIFSAKSNNVINGSESKGIYSFSDAESWQYHGTSDATDIEIYGYAVSLDQGETLTITDDGTISGNILPASIIDVSNTAFDNLARAALQEKPRMFNRTLFLNGTLSTLDSGTLIDDHVHLLGQNAIFSAFDHNSSSDEFRLAYSVITETADDSLSGASARIIIEFSTTDDTSGEYARIDINNTDLTGSRYFVEKVSLADLTVTSGFSWHSVANVKIYAAVIDSLSATMDNCWIALDGLRFENVSDEAINSAYGMTSYSIVGTDSSLPIEKPSNTPVYIEYNLPVTLGGS